MLRLDRAQGALTVVSRLARPHVLAILAGVLGAVALVVARATPEGAAALALAAALLVVLGGRAVRVTFARGRVRIRPAVPFQSAVERRLEEFTRTAIETVGEERARRMDRLAEGYRARSGTEIPTWLRAPVAPGRNDHLRRLVLVAPGGEPVAVTAWLAPGDDLEALRAEVDALLG